MAGVEPVVERLSDDLDVPGALAALDRLAGDDALPPGARFEAFAHLDRLLGLDLASEVGRSR
jgi:cysteinyl-tRNA synthetase